MLIARAFGVPLRGDPLTLAILSAALLTSAVAIGVLIASMVRTLQQALLVAFFVLFPVLFLSGTLTPIESMPEGLQLLSRLSPLRYYMDALLGVFLKGVGLEVLWPQLVWMLGRRAVRRERHSLPAAAGLSMPPQTGRCRGGFESRIVNESSSALHVHFTCQALPFRQDDRGLPAVWCCTVRPDHLSWELER